MPTAALDELSFHGILSEEGIVVVQCWATWCAGCADLGSDFERVSRRHPDVLFARLETGAHPDLTKTLGVAQVPSTLVFRDGILLLRQPGQMGTDELEDLVAQAVSLDMNHVRAELKREAREEALAVSF